MNNKTFTITCNNCGKTVVLQENVYKDNHMVEKDGDSSIDIHGTTNETSIVECICGNKIERY